MGRLGHWFPVRSALSLWLIAGWADTIPSSRLSIGYGSTHCFLSIQGKRTWWGAGVSVSPWGSVHPVSKFDGAVLSVIAAGVGRELGCTEDRGSVLTLCFQCASTRLLDPSSCTDLQHIHESVAHIIICHAETRGKSKAYHRHSL